MSGTSGDCAGRWVNAVDNIKVIGKISSGHTRTDPLWGSKGASECIKDCLSSSSKRLSTSLPWRAQCGRQLGWQAEPALSRGAGEGWPTSHRFPSATLSKAMFPFSHSQSLSFKPHWTPTGVKKSLWRTWSSSAGQRRLEDVTAITLAWGKAEITPVNPMMKTGRRNTANNRQPSTLPKLSSEIRPRGCL